MTEASKVPLVAAAATSPDVAGDLEQGSSNSSDSPTILSQSQQEPVSKDLQEDVNATGQTGMQPGNLSCSRRRGGINLEWRNIQCFVAEKLEQSRAAKWLGLEEREGAPTKQIVHDANGFAKEGEILAVMGPSGSGKTTLFNVLAQRPTLGQSGYWQGKLLLNGGEPWANWERDMAYVMQRDIFYDELQVYENLIVTALLRLPRNWSKQEKLDHLEKTIDHLGLQDVKNTKVGSATDRGLSGGETKRTSIANESLAMPRIFLLDEPLTGLDSTRAVEVMKSLHKMAHEDGITVMLTIHQPSSAIYATFDRLLLMGQGGRAAYFGHVNDALPYFTKIGYPLPSQWAPSDHFIELLSEEDTRKLICDAWATAPLEMSPPAPQPRPDSLSPMYTFVEQVRVLLPRSFKRIRRTYLKALNIKLHIALSLTWGCIYFGVGRHPHQRITDFIGAIFFVIAHWSWTPLFQGLGNFPKEKDMLTKEKASKVYDIRSFVASQVLGEIPVSMVLPLLFIAIIWPMSSLAMAEIGQCYLFIMLNVQVCSAMSMWISAVTMDDEAAITVAIIVMVFEMCTGGYFADMRKVPVWIGWTRYTSIYYYSYGSITRLLVKEPYGEEVYHQAIAKYSFSELGYLYEALIMTGYAILYRSLAYIQLRTTKKLTFK